MPVREALRSAAEGIVTIEPRRGLGHHLQRRAEAQLVEVRATLGRWAPSSPRAADPDQIAQLQAILDEVPA
jgi:DNA-binding GntR family transcriptional regulator